MNEYYQWYKEHHICVDCKTNDAVKGKVKCFYCLQNDAERKRKERETVEYQEKKKELAERAKRTREDRLKNGICVRCGRRKAEPNKTSCSYCLAIRRNEMRRKRNGTQKNRKQRGMCLYCDNPPIKGKYFCKKHYEMEVELAENARKYIKPESIKKRKLIMWAEMQYRR